MRKVVFLGAALFLVVTAMAFAGRAEITQALDSYEAVVLEAERLAEIALVSETDFTTLDERARTAGTAITNVASDREWVIEDARRSAVLRARFNQAIATIAGKLLKY